MNEPLKIAICDDDISEEEKLKQCLANSLYKTECITYRSGEEFLENFKPSAFDLILMDIYMDGISGIEAISKIREIDKDVPVAFITTSLDYTLESYRLSALRYIEKPYEQEAIDGILKLAKIQKEAAPCLLVNKSGKYEKLLLSKIVFLEQQARQIIIYQSDGSVEEIYEKISNIMSQLEMHNFIHCHKSYVVNLSHVQYIDKNLRCFIMDDNSSIPIRRESFSKFKKIFEDYLFRFSMDD